MHNFSLFLMNEVSDLLTLLPLIIPLVILQLGLQIFGLIDLSKRSKVKFDNKLMWALIVVLGGIIGAAVYLITGRLEDDISSID
jgi:ABC-type multidrug transport system permease subunit